MAIVRERFTEGSSGYIRGQIVDKDGNAVNGEDLTAATLTLYDMQTKAIINSRDEQDINAAGLSPSSQNDVTYEPDGYFRWDLQPEVRGASPTNLGDNPILTARRQIERHRAEFHFEFPGGAFNYAVEIEVVAMQQAGS